MQLFEVDDWVVRTRGRGRQRSDRVVQVYGRWSIVLAREPERKRRASEFKKVDPIDSVIELDVFDA